MKTGWLSLTASVAVLSVASANDSASKASDPPTNAPDLVQDSKAETPVSPKVAAQVEKEKLAKEADAAVAKARQLQREIQGIEAELAESKRILKDMEALKKQMQAENEKLKASWAEEVDAVVCAGPSVIETYRAMADQLNRTLGENKELKARVGELEKKASK
jgi:DNA repair exonuclease SbcCD ATPase subunit